MLPLVKPKPVCVCVYTRARTKAGRAILADQIQYAMPYPPMTYSLLSPQRPDGQRDRLSSEH